MKKQVTKTTNKDISYVTDDGKSFYYKIHAKEHEIDIYEHLLEDCLVLIEFPRFLRDLEGTFWIVNSENNLDILLKYLELIGINTENVSNNFQTIKGSLINNHICIGYLTYQDGTHSEAMSLKKCKSDIFACFKKMEETFFDE